MATAAPTSTPASVYEPLPDTSKIVLQPSKKLNYIEEEPIIMSEIKDPKPILQEEKSNITTNAFIPDHQKKVELSVIQSEANDIILKQYNENISSSIQKLSLSDINKNISKSCIGLLDDSFNKPDDITWVDYIQVIIKKDQRYTYIGILFIFIAFYILLVSN